MLPDPFPELTRDDVFRLETRRLWLRWPRHADAEAVATLAGDRAVAEATARLPHPYPREAADAFVLETRARALRGECLRLALAPKAQPTRLVGMIGVEPNAAGDGVLGYWLGKPYWGQGLATEAARAMIDAVFTVTPVAAIAASVRVGNPASRRVLEKCGFLAEGPAFQDTPLRGRIPVDTFRLSRRDWASLKAWSRDGYAPAPLGLAGAAVAPDPVSGSGSAAAAATGRPLFLAAE